CDYPLEARHQWPLKGEICSLNSIPSTGPSSEGHPSREARSPPVDYQARSSGPRREAEVQIADVVGGWPAFGRDSPTAILGHSWRVWREQIQIGRASCRERV